MLFDASMKKQMNACLSLFVDMCVCTAKELSWGLKLIITKFTQVTL